MSSIVRRLSLLMFLRYAALGFSAPYINVYLTEIGFSGTDIGVLVSIGAFFELFLIPMMNAMADRMRRHRRLYAVLTAGAGVANLVFAFTGAPILLKGAFLLNHVTARSNSTLLSQLTITKLDQIKRNIFARVRVWGSVGWTVATLISGPMITLASYPLALIGAAFSSFAMLPFLTVLPQQTTEEDTPQAKPEPRRMSFYILAASQFMFFVGVNGVGTFIWVFIEKDLHVPPDQIGQYAAIFAISEILPMLLLDRLFERFGIRRVLIVGMMGMCVVWLLYPVLPSAIWLIPLQALRGSTFPMFILGVTLLVTRTSAPANVATNQAIIQVTMPALAMLITAPLTGWIWDYAGSHALFAFSAVMGFISVGILILNFDRLAPKTKHPAMEQAV